MRAGALDTLATIRRLPEPTWEDGERTNALGADRVDAGQFWADVREQTGREALRAGQVDADQPVVVTGRYEDASGVQGDDQLALDDGRVLDVVSVREIGRRQGVEILCHLNRDRGA